MWDCKIPFVYSWSPVAGEAKTLKTQLKMLQVKVTKMNDLKFKKDLFNPLKTGRKIDEFFSG